MAPSAEGESSSPGAEVQNGSQRHEAPASRLVAKLSRALSLEPPHGSVEDFYAAAGDARAIRDRTRSELRQDYPMTCFCSPDRPDEGKLCRGRPDGHRGRVPWRRKLLWAWPTFGWYALKYLKVGYMYKFYVDDYPQASLGFIAFSSVLSVLVDAFTDPKMAAWTDNLKSKYGRRRPFIFAAAFFVPVIFVLAWSPGLVGPGLPSSLWYGFFHICYKLADTLFLIPHDAWGAQISPIYKEKTLVWQWREVMMSLGIVTGMAVVPLIFVTEQCSSSPDDGCWQLPIISAVFGLIFMQGCLQLVFFGKEPSAPQPDAAVVPRSCSGFTEEDTVPTLIATFLNRPFRILLISDVVKAVGHDIPLSVLPFMTSWVLGEKCFEASFFFGICVVAALVCGLLSVPLWTLLTAKTNKYRAYFCYNCAGVLGCFTMGFMGFDSGDCVYSYASLVAVAIFGVASGGHFLLYDMISDVVDYDEFLTGGRRREASYLMAVEFVPKFMSIPGECIPFLLLAYFSYARPLGQSSRLACGNLLQAGTGLSPDAFCHSFYANETLGTHLCSDTTSCNDLIAAGVGFICNDALGECGIKQNEAVRWVLRASASFFPCVCVLVGTCALLLYPRSARNEEAHHSLLLAITRLRRGEVVEDPWRRGSFVHPAESPEDITDPAVAATIAGALAYFTPGELKAVAEASPLEGEAADLSHLVKRSALLCFAFGVLIPVGCVVVAWGFDELSNDLGASVSPLGLMGVGVGLCGVWFNGVRVSASLELRRRRARRQDVVARYNRMCPFTGTARLPS